MTPPTIRSGEKAAIVVRLDETTGASILSEPFKAALIGV